MKALIENWRRFVEGQNSFPYRIYCDMDGVLVDFISPTLAYMNEKAKDKSLSPRTKKMAQEAIKLNGRDHFIEDDLKSSKTPGGKASRNYMFAVLRGDSEFWANLPWAPGGQELWNHIKQYNPSILTSPMDKASEEGKLIWVQKNLDLPNSEVTFSHNKWDYAITDGKPNVLIDDYHKKVGPFRKKGGHGILHTTGKPQDTIKKLEDLNAEKDTTKT